MSGYLILASNFDNWSGPNNPLLDLCNYLYNDMHVDLKLATHRCTQSNDFLGWAKFPIVQILRGKSSGMQTRLAQALPNTKIIRDFRGPLGLPSDNIFVNSSIDTLFSAYMSAGERVKVGYNVLRSNPNSSFFKANLFDIIDRLSAKKFIGKILAHTEFHKKEYEKMGIEEERIRVIPHCIDIARIEKMSLGSRSSGSYGPTIFFCGRLTEGKGIRALLNSYEIISKDVKSELVIVGKGPLSELVLRRSGEIQSRSRNAWINYMGWQPTSTLLRKMREADIVVVPSWGEPFGMVILEAMALKKPIITTRIGGVSELIKDHVDGILVNPDIEGIVAALTELLGSPRKRASIGENAFRTVNDKYSVKKVAPKFLNFLEENISEH